MERSTLNTFFQNTFGVSRFVFIVLFLSYISIALYAWSFNLFLFLLLMSNFYLLSLVMSYFLVLKSDNPNCFEKWNNKAQRKTLIHEKLSLTYLLTGIFVASNIVFYFVLTLVRQMKVTVDNSTVLVICLLLGSDILLSKSFLYWVAESIRITGYSQERKVILTKFIDMWKFLALFLYCFILINIINVMIADYFIHGNFIPSSVFVTIVLLLELINVYFIYFFVLRKSKNNFERIDQVVII